MALTPVRVGSVVPRLVFYALRDIEAGEELTIKYGSGYHSSSQAFSHQAKPQTTPREVLFPALPYTTDIDFGILEGRKLKGYSSRESHHFDMVHKDLKTLSPSLTPDQVVDLFRNWCLQDVCVPRPLFD